MIEADPVSMFNIVSVLSKRAQSLAKFCGTWGGHWNFHNRRNSVCIVLTRARLIDMQERLHLSIADMASV